MIKPEDIKTLELSPKQRRERREKHGRSDWSEPSPYAHEVTAKLELGARLFVDTTHFRRQERLMLDEAHARVRQMIVAQLYGDMRMAVCELKRTVMLNIGYASCASIEEINKGFDDLLAMVWPAPTTKPLDKQLEPVP